MCRFRLKTANRGYETGGADDWLLGLSGLLKIPCLMHERLLLVCSMDNPSVDVHSPGRQGEVGLTHKHLCSDGIARDLPSGGQEGEGEEA
jgi:hypothetical protein